MKTLKTFKQVTKEKNIHHEGFTINSSGEAVPNSPIHFRVIGDKTKKKINKNEVKEAVAFTPAKKSLRDLPGQIKGSEEEQKKHHEEHSKKLSSTQVTPTEKQKEHIENYTSNSMSGNGSTDINNALINNHKMGRPSTHGMSKVDAETHQTITKLTKNPIGHETHLYSGTGFDPRAAAHKSKNGIIHMPAHTSTSHNAMTASHFADMAHENHGTGRHIMHIHVKATDKGYHVGEHSETPEEHETILPAGTKLKYSHSTEHHDDDGNKYHVHHFTIHSQK
jgi:hypothetical protein